MFRVDFNAHGFDPFALLHGRQVFFGLVAGSFASINLQPPGRDHDFSFCFERLAFHSRDTSRVLVLCRWKKHGHKTFAYHVEDCLLVVIE